MRFVRLFSLPTWLLARFIIPYLPSRHPWKGRRFTLTEWSESETILCQEFDFWFWMLLGFMFVLLV